jgi:hypothetical protein
MIFLCLTQKNKELKSKEEELKELFLTQKQILMKTFYLIWLSKISWSL